MKKLLLTLTLGATVATGMAVTPLWMRDVRISPDGTEILFCYNGKEIFIRWLLPVGKRFS